MPEENPRRRRFRLPLILGALVLLLGAGGYWGWVQYGAPEPEPEPIIEAPVPLLTTTAYGSSTMRVSAEYPQAFVLEESYAYTAFEGKPISGVKFFVSPQFVEGTNLSPESGVSIEQLPRARTCSGDIFLLANVQAQEVMEGTTSYSLATSSSGGIEEQVFALASSSPCTAIRYFIRTSVSTTSTSTAQFDRSALTADFDAIRDSLRMQ